MKLISEFLKLENGEPEGYNSEAYCYYFYENIQIYEDGFVEKKNRKPEDKDSHDRYSKGVTINEFARLFGSLYKDENEHYEEFGKILTNKRLQKLQIELLDKGINVCMLNKIGRASCRERVCQYV